MPAVEVFVDTGLNGAAAAFIASQPFKLFRFKKDKNGFGIRIKPWVEFCRELNNRGRVNLIFEDPARVPRSLTTLSTQYIVIGQTLGIAEAIFKTPPFAVSTNQWFAWARKETNIGDNKQAAAALARQHFDYFLQAEFPGKRNLPEGVTDCLGLAVYHLAQIDKTFTFLNIEN